MLWAEKKAVWVGHDWVEHGQSSSGPLSCRRQFMFRKGDPGREGQRAFTATAGRSHSFLGMSPIPDLPRDNDVVTEEDLSTYEASLGEVRF
jgi:hypothetical protein